MHRETYHSNCSLPASPKVTTHCEGDASGGNHRCAPTTYCFGRAEGGNGIITIRRIPVVETPEATHPVKRQKTARKKVNKKTESTQQQQTVTKEKPLWKKLIK